MEADGPDVKRPRLDTHYPPHSSVPPPPPARYHEPAPPPAAYPPNTLPPPPIQAHPPSVPGTPLGPRAPRALPEPINFSQHPNQRPGNAPPVTIPSRSYSVDSLSRPPSNPNQPSPIDTRPRQLAVSGPPPPEGPHQQPPPPPMDHGGHHPGAYPNHDPHMNGAAPAPYPPPANHHNPYNGPPPMGPTQSYHPSPYAQPGVYGQAADYVGAGRKRQVRAVQVCWPSSAHITLYHTHITPVGLQQLPEPQAEMRRGAPMPVLPRVRPEMRVQGSTAAQVSNFFSFFTALLAACSPELQARSNAT